MAAKAAPAAAMAGLLAVGPAYAAVASTGPAQAVVVTEQMHTDALVSHDKPASSNTDQPASRSYTVEPGDTLSAISQRIYGTPADALWLFQANQSVIRNPNLIYPGQVLNLPAGPMIGATVQATTRQQPAAGQAAANPPASASAAPSALSGTLGCTGLEELWEQAGGAPAEAVTAASIAMAESGGRQYATGPAGERGYWQIHPDHGSLSTYDPQGNAHAAVVISADGTDWTPWTTYTSGLYRGRC